MAKKKSTPAEAVKSRARRAAPKKAAPKKLADTTRIRKKKAVVLQPPKKLFIATRWFGAFPELKGPTLTIQRQLRDEW